MPRKFYRKEHRYVSSVCVWVGDAYSLIDGMRYDSCYPATERESQKIERLIGHSAEPADHVIRLVRVARNDAPPTIDRWRSFNAHVLDVRHREDEPLSDDALATLVKLNVEALQQRVRRR